MPRFPNEYSQISGLQSWSTPCNRVGSEEAAMRARSIYRAVTLAVMTVMATITWMASAAKRSFWRDLGAVPGASMGFKPQGLTIAGRWLMFTDHRYDTGSTLYRLNKETLAVEGTAEMPREATHPGGLAWDGSRLWAVDYNANRLYAIDAEKSFATGRAVVVASYPTHLRRTSALAFVLHNGVPFLAISDFGAPVVSRTYLLPIDRVGQLNDRPLREVASFSYDNGGFSQGLTSDGRFLYEALNRVGRDEIRVLRVDDRGVTVVARFDAPGDDVEDLAFDGETLYTSDEGTFRFYATQIVRDFTRAP
jgi:glutamine cyclotransferase